MPRAHRYAFALFSIVVALGGCSVGTKAPVVSKEPNLWLSGKPQQRAGAETNDVKEIPPFHIVSRGETLSLIAWRYGRDYREIAAWNGLRKPYIVYPSQRLKLSPSTGRVKLALVAKPERALLSARPKSREKSHKPSPSPTPTQRSSPAPVKPTMNAEARPPQSLDRKPVPAEPAPAKQAKDGLQWQWPASGKVEAASSTRGTKGVNILGREGQTVKAAAPGEIVYSGSGLTGYGKLIIVKHDENYLSAYAHNYKLLRKEGDKVAAGQPIAEMGSTGAKQTMLHFEIRRSGKPVNPLDYLPKL